MGRRFVYNDSTETTPNMTKDIWIGKKLGSYQILSLIGVGGSGRVYKARHTFLEREAAMMEKEISRLRFELDKMEEIRRETERWRVK